MKKQKGKHDCYVEGAQGVYGVCTGRGAKGEALSDSCVPLVRVQEMLCVGC